VKDIILESLDRLLWRLRSRREPPVILTDSGLQVSECARRQAALNIRESEECKQRVIQALALKMGSLEAGLAEAKRRYPEGFEKRPN
jgi:hypothetical protein